MESNWDFENDLKLVKQKLTTSSKSDKCKIHGLVQKILRITAADEDIPRKCFFTAKEDDSKGGYRKIMGKLFEYLPTKDLFNCRLVSRDWNEKVLELALVKRKKHNVKLSGHRISEIVNKDNISSPFLFSRLNIQLEDIKINDCSSFFSRYGAYVKALQIRSEGCPQADELCNADYQFNLKTIFQNVKEIHDLSIIKLPKSVVKQPFVFSQKELESFSLPNVRFLLLSLSCYFSPEFSEGFFSMLKNVKLLEFSCSTPTKECGQVIHGIQKLQLKYLACRTGVSAKFWSNLHSQQLKVLHVNPSAESEQDLASWEAFLQSQRHTLETLRLLAHRTPMMNPVRKAQLPIMENLDTLIFEDQSASYFEVVRSHQVPKLQSTKFHIGVHNLGTDASDHFMSGVFPKVLKLRSLQDPLLDLEYVDWDYNGLGQMFPNLKELSVYASYAYTDDEFHPFKCEMLRSFPTLEALDLNIWMDNTQPLNLLLSGFTKESGWIMYQLMDILTLPELLKIRPNRASLRDMASLKQLRLRLTCPELIPIDNVGLQLGLMCTQPLERLRLLGDFLITKDTAKTLSNYHRNVVIFIPPG